MQSHLNGGRTRKLRIAAAGDLHCCEEHHEQVQRAFEELAEAGADLVLLCGDLTTHGEPSQAAVLADACAGLEIPVFAVLGNPDWHANRRDELVATLEGGGVRVLDRDWAVCELAGVQVGVVGAIGQVRAGNPPPVVLSVYLDLDPERFGTAPARASAVRSLIDDARREVESHAGSASLTHAQRIGLRADLERIAEHLKAGGYTEGARAHAVFSCQALDFFESLKLPEPVENRVVVDEMPFIAPLVEIGPPSSWCVALINRRAARIFRGSPESLAEVTVERDDVHGQHDQGGWSQPRYERSIEQEVDEHIKRAAELLLKEQQRRAFIGLLIAAPEELRGRIKSALHAYVLERFAGWVDVDVEHSSEEAVRSRAAPLIQQWDAERIHERLDRLRAEIGRDGRAAAGPEKVLESLYERRVETLLFQRGKPIPGAVCPRCGLMRTRDGTCPVDGSALDERDDLLEPALHAAMGRDAEVFEVDGPDLSPLGGIAALLRF